MDKVALAKRVIIIRRALGLNQSDLANKSNLSRSSICLIEQGVKDIQLRTAIKLSAGLGVSLNVIAGIDVIPIWIKNIVDVDNS